MLNHNQSSGTSAPSADPHWLHKSYWRRPNGCGRAQRGLQKVPFSV